MVRSIRFWIAVVLVGILLCCIIAKHGRSAQHEQTVSAPVSGSAASTLITSAATVSPETVRTVTSSASAAADAAATTVTAVTTFSAEPDEPEFDATVPEISGRKVREITEKLFRAAQYSADLIGWIYLADSEIDYPVVQGNDNQFYLHHAPDGSENELGTIFLHSQCAADFSDRQNILFGHNMASGMFGDIRSFKEREEFDRHRYGWLFTKDTLYRIDFCALVIVSAYDAMYDVPADSTQWLKAMREHSMYYTEPELCGDDTVIALSTCANDFADARALFTGKLVRICSVEPPVSDANTDESR